MNLGRKRATCSQCGGTDIEAATIDHAYDECGLKGVTLLGVPADTCQTCGSTRVRIWNIEGLHRALAEWKRSGESTIRLERKRDAWVPSAA